MIDRRVNLDDPEPRSPRIFEINWEAEEHALCVPGADVAPLPTGVAVRSPWVLLPPSLMLAPVEGGAKPPSGLAPLFARNDRSKPPRRAWLDALQWGWLHTTPLQDALFAWLLFGGDSAPVRRAIVHRARKWAMAPGRRDLIIDTAMAHVPEITYNQHPPAWLNFQREFVDDVNRVLGWIDREFRAARSLTRSRKIRLKCYNEIKGIENLLTNCNAEKLQFSTPIFCARDSAITRTGVHSHARLLPARTRGAAHVRQRVRQHPPELAT